MQRNLIFAATLFAFSLFFAQVGFAEESSGFVARNAALQQRAADAAQQQALVKQAAPEASQVEAAQDS